MPFYTKYNDVSQSQLHKSHAFLFPEVFCFFITNISLRCKVVAHGMVEVMFKMTQ